MLTKGKGVASPPLLQTPLHPSASKREMEIHVNLAEWGFGENNACKCPLRIGRSAGSQHGTNKVKKVNISHCKGCIREVAQCPVSNTYYG
jgi:hypothetical protein